MKFIKVLLIFCYLIISQLTIFSQTAPSKYWVQFKDKNNSTYSVSNPLEFLSQRAIDRRKAMNISITEQDFPVNSTYLDSISNSGGIILTTSRWHNGATFYTNDTNIAKRILAMSFVVQVQKTANINKNRMPISNNPNFSVFKDINKTLSSNKEQLDFINKERENPISSYNYGAAYQQNNMINVDYLHQLGYSGKGMLIAVLDAGFRKVDVLPAFDSLWANNQIVGYKDFVNPNDIFFDQSTHGMMVLSIISGQIPGSLVGTAPKASYLLLRSEDAGSEYMIEEDNWVAAIEYADSCGADVVNSSLGYTKFDDPLQVRSYADMTGKKSRASQAATFAIHKGIIVCNSAGNSAEQTWHYIGAPADANGILTVGAVNYLRNYATFSSVGPSADGRVKPDIAAMGEATFVQNESGSVISGNGTSFSCPVITGAVACLWQAFPNCSNFDIMDAIRKSADKYYNPDTLTGYGIPDFKLAYEFLMHKNFKLESNISTFPNPFHSELNIIIDCDYRTDGHIFIYDIKGKLIFNTSINDLQIGNNKITINNTDVLNNGIYILKIVTNKNVYSSKIIKS